MTEKGRWFRVYARQIHEHDKFAGMSGLELGAWLALRSEAELRDRATLRSRADAVLVLRQRRIPKPAVMLERLIALRLFDVDDLGRITVHDRADHDRPLYPSDSPEQVAARKRKSREEGSDSHEDVTSRDGESHDTHARVPPQQAKPSPSIQPTAPANPSLPGEDDSATLACRYFLNGGHWLGDEEYTHAWDELDRRYTPEWVQAEIQPAYTQLHEANPRVKPWNLKRMTEFRLAERARSEERQRERALAEANQRQTEEMRRKAEEASEEERQRAEIIRRAVGLWIKRRPNEPIPTDFAELAGWLEQNGVAA